MIDDKTPDTTGQPTYEQNIIVSQETTSASTEPNIQDRTTKSYEDEDIERYGINSPIREIIYANIVKQELQKPTCIESKQTKTTE